uniref:Uncharacterized protein n=1 Tax=Heterorhabditis bacteriophora TaxID=37862 RepID=A0A1I7WRM0_HETBA
MVNDGISNGRTRNETQSPHYQVAKQGRSTNAHCVDSKVVLTWLLSSRRFPIFVKNQLERIITIQLNPSNIGTRGCKRKDANSTIWINGPT